MSRSGTRSTRASRRSPLTVIDAIPAGAKDSRLLLSHFDPAPLPDGAALRDRGPASAGRRPRPKRSQTHSCAANRCGRRRRGLLDRCGAAGHFTRLAARPSCGPTATARTARSLSLLRLHSVGGPRHCGRSRRRARAISTARCARRRGITRAPVCIGCGGARTLSLRGVEGDSGVVMRRNLRRMRDLREADLRSARTPKPIPYADDLATLGLDMMIGEAGWSRHAPHPLLLVAVAG